jgi:calcium-dependent protein kinase
MGNGKINYSEFLAATVSIKSVLTNELLWGLFKHFDTDDSDFITSENIQEAMAKVGKAIDD